MKTIAVVLIALVPVLAGDLTARYELTLNRVLSGESPKFDEEFILADAVPREGRRFTNFSGDLSGRYIGALASAASYSGRGWPALDRIATRAIALQKPDGHFGSPLTQGRVAESDMATLWGNGRMLIGLLEYYRLTQREDVLASARKLGDFLVAVAPRFNAEEVRREYNGEKFAVGYICWTQNIEGVVELYRQTHDQRYLTLARQLAERVDRHPSQHSHGYLCSVRGVLDLYRVTRESRYLDQARREWKGVIDSGNVLVSGAVPEMFAPMIKRDEGCSEADWLRLSLDLWQITRDPDCLAQAERTLFNEFAFNQFSTGDFGHHVLTTTGVAPPMARAWWCCTCHGLRALVAALGSAFHERDGALFYDLPVDGSGSSGGLSVEADSALRKDGTVVLTISKADEPSHTLGVRLPAWASEVTLSLAGADQLPVEKREGYVTVTRQWNTGDRIIVTYRMRTRVETDAKVANKVAVFHGPWLLAVDEALSPNYFDEPSAGNHVQLPALNDGIQLDPWVTVGPTQTFAVPAARFRFQYRPGGYPMQPGAGLLRPIAEFTDGPDFNRLDFWLPLSPEKEKLDSNYKP